MPTLFDTYRDYETDQLEMIAEHWGIEAEINWRNQVILQITDLLANEDLFGEIVDTLPETSKTAFFDLFSTGGRIPLTKFSRTYGKLREMGAAIRERERPDRNPETDTERLYYLGLIGTAFFEDSGETKEFFFIPDEFLNYSKEKTHPKTVSDQLEIIPTSDIRPTAKRPEANILDLLSLRLASFRGNVPEHETQCIFPAAVIPFLDQFLFTYQAIDEKTKVLNTEKVKHLLMTPESELMLELFHFWHKNESINDLKSTPDLVFEGQWFNDPLKPRQRIIEFINRIIKTEWILVDDFIDWIYKNEPDYLRTGGEYEQWFIRRTDQDTYLKGFSSWPNVDGALIRHLITGPMQWFGILDISQTKLKDGRLVFRKSKFADNILNKVPFENSNRSDHKIRIHKNGMLLVPKNAEREMLYQVARFCTWKGYNESFLKFHIDPNTMRRAKNQNISSHQIKTILKKYGQQPIPQNIFQAIDHWKRSPNGIVAEEQLLVRFNDPNIIQKLKGTTIYQLVEEELNESTIIIKRNNVIKFENGLIEAGYLLDFHAKYNHHTK